MTGGDELTGTRSPHSLRTWLLAVVIAVLLLAAVTFIGLQWTSETSPVARPTPSATPTPTPSPSAAPRWCTNSAEEPFRPTRITIPGVTRNARVLALPRDGQNVPSVPPVSNAGKQQIAWDRPPGIKPGDTKGNVLLNAHTWPDGSALGNELLRELKVGKRIIVRNGDVELCYRVDKKIEVLASDGYPPYYDKEGPHQVALLVCSGRRLGPGNWTHRTIWFASPV
jgi:sortase family protein